MTKCQNCGNQNYPEANFCRFCGTKFNVLQPQEQAHNNPYDHVAPRPYAWKTDEFTTNAEARKTSSSIGTAPIVQQFPNGRTQNVNQPLALYQPAHLSQPYRCPHCMSQFLPRIEKRISTAGWVTFAVLLVFFFPLFWIGLLIKEETHTCPSCNAVVDQR